MSQYVEGPTKTFPVSGALGQFLRVKTPTSLALAGATDFALGTMEKPTFSGDTYGTVRLPNASGTRKMVASAAISAGVPVFGAASGKIAASGTVLEGISLESATADNDVIEVLTGAPFGYGVVLHTRQRFTVAQINAGATILAAVPGYKYRLVDVALIAIGGTVGGSTTIDILATQSASSVKLLAATVAALTASTLLRAGATNAAILASGASFVQNDVNTAITIGKTGGDATTATHVDVLLSYEIEV
jgi:hypothetical protein